MITDERKCPNFPTMNLLKNICPNYINIPIDKLEDFSEALLDFNSPPDLTHWLDNHSH